MTEDSGRLWIEEGTIHYRSSTYGDWDLPLREVRIIGECTNQHGPFADDWFFAFVRSAEAMWLEASCYAEGNDPFLRDLQACLGYPHEPRLCLSTDFASRIMWPVELAGEPMFDFRKQGRGWGATVNQYLSEAVLAFLGDEHRQCPTGE